MDPLALLSDDEDGEDAPAASPDASKDEAGPDAEADAEPQAKRARSALDFEALQRAGYAARETEKDERAEAEDSLRSTFAALEQTRVQRVEAAPASPKKQATETENVPEFGCEVPPDSIEIYDEFGNDGSPEPWATFDRAEAGLGKEIVDVMRSSGFSEPTPIQAHTWPILVAGRDLIGVAKTGSGKTLAFLLPCFIKLMQEKSGRKRPAENELALPVQMLKPASGAGAYSPQILVLAPSRELVMQIETEAKKFSAATGITTLACYGGAGMRGAQLGRLREHPECVVGSVGRLNDFIDNEKHWFGVSSVRFLILDEADAMLGEGLNSQIRKITTDVETPHRQTMMFSATFDDDVRDLSSWILKRPVEVRVGMKDPLRANKDVDQRVVIVKDEHDKDGALKTLLRQHYNPNAKDPGKVLIFTFEPEMCDSLAKKIKAGHLGAEIDTLHANRGQGDREKAITNFRNGKVSILIATNLAGRGLDIKDVKVVINFDPPEDALDYVHRIGRTGRAGRKGTAITLLRKGPDGRAMAYIAQVMRRTGLRVPTDLIDALKQRRGRDREFAAKLLEGLCNFEKIDRNWASQWGGRA
eukprot:TRINITY_DN24992_c0_g1_i1.p1 TRINITY_DN24992_c0_g1~~TRINITY_DN24992_c0_g1_i1.p1  ORF type:complete len:587 (+),score=100.78 TRINITY_DN24992_c0_g1_i1:63-1823(+)